MTLMLQSPSFDFHWEPRPGTFHFESPGRSLAAFLGVEVVQRGHVHSLLASDLVPTAVEHQTLRDHHGPAEELEIRYQESHGLILAIRIRMYSSRPFVLLRLALINKGPEVVHLRRFFFQTLPGALRPIADPTGFYRTGWQSWSTAGFLHADERDHYPNFLMRKFTGPMLYNSETPHSGKVGRFWSESVGVLATPREALVAGGVSLADQFVQVGVDLRPEELKLVIQSQGDDVPMAVGEARNSEWFYLEWVPFPNTDPLAQYAYAVARQMEAPLLRDAPVGWSSWYMFWAKVVEEDIIDNLATAVLLGDTLPLEVIQLDQGFERIWGDWTERNEHFPHTLKWLADRIKGSGCRPGLWLGPLTVHPRSQLATEHSDWLLCDRRGRPVSAGLLSNGFIGRALDATHPGVEDYLRKLIRTAVEEWGYTYLKLDFLYAAALSGHRYNQSLTRAQAYRHALRIMREAAGADTFLVGCGAPLGPAIGLVDAMRIGPDTAPNWAPDVPGILGFLKRDPALPSLRNSTQNVIARAWMHGRWWINDPDNLMVRDLQTALTEEEVVTQATLLGLSGGLPVLSDDLAKVPPERLEIASTLFPPLIEGLDVLDLFKNAHPATLVSPVACVCGNWRLVGLFNWGDKPVERALPRDLPDFNVQQDYHIVDFWKRRYFCLRKGDPLPKFSVSPHGCVLLGIRPVKDAPQLVGTTFHISQGGEVTAFESGDNFVSLSLTLGRLAEGEVWLALPAPPKSAMLDDTVLPREACHAVSPGIWAVHFRLSYKGSLYICY